jgi:predicted transcriptional regulator of viral defense system
MKTIPDFDQLYEIAEGQAGYFTASQAASVGFSQERLSNTVKSGKFRRAAQGVYRLTHFPASKHEDLFIAWLITGPNSVISHESALSLYELSDVLPREVHVIVPRSASRRRKNIRLHTNKLEPDEITSRYGLPVTTVIRTLFDVASSGLAEELLRQAIEEASQRGLATKGGLLIQAERGGGRFKKIFQKLLLEEETK